MSLSDDVEAAREKALQDRLAMEEAAVKLAETWAEVDAMQETNGS